MDDCFALLAFWLGVPSLPDPPQPAPVGATCAVTGRPLTVGYPLHELATSERSWILDTFPGGIDGWVSEPVARLLKGRGPRAAVNVDRSHALVGGQYWSPVLSRASATPERPCWSDLVRTLWPTYAGQRCLLILTTDPKKRVWPQARQGTLGANTPWRVYAPEYGLDGVFWIDWPRFLDVLDLVEEAYALGVPKAALVSGSWRTVPRTRAALATQLRLFRSIAAVSPILRALAVVIAQKPAERSQ